MIVGCLLAVLAACKPGTPKQYIQPDKMENILVDYHLAKAMGQYARVPEENSRYSEALYLEAVLKKHKVSKALFDSSLVYYYTRADRFEPIYQKVAERLETQALNLGASEGEMGKYSSARGDTANIWSDRPSVLLVPVAPYNRLDFEILADTAFRQGDKFLFQFMSDFMYQQGARRGVIYVSMEYGDTVQERHQLFSSTGLTKMEFTTLNNDTIQSLKGYVLLPEVKDQAVNNQLLFLNNIQLIRFHKPDENKTNSLSRGDRR